MGRMRARPSEPTLASYRNLLDPQNSVGKDFLRFFWNSAMVSIFVVTITMLISVPAAFALARMRFWGSATLATGVFLTYLIPETLLFIPLFKMFAMFGEATGIQLINRRYVQLILHPSSQVPFSQVFRRVREIQSPVNGFRFSSFHGTIFPSLRFNWWLFA